MDELSNTLNSNVSVQIDLLRKKMVTKLGMLSELKTEFNLYWECNNFLAINRSTSSPSASCGDKINVDCDKEIFTGALNYVTERTTQFKILLESVDASSQTKSSKKEMFVKCKEENETVIPPGPTKTEDKSLTECNYADTRKILAKNIAKSDKNIPSLCIDEDMKMIRDRIAEIKKENAHLMDQNYDLKAENKKLSDEIWQAKRKYETIIKRVDHLEKNFQEERNRRKFIEEKCATGKCQPMSFESVKTENFLLKEKNKVLLEEVSVLRKKVDCQRSQLSNMNQAYRKMIDKLQERSASNSTVNRKRWLNDKFDENSYDSAKKRLKIWPEPQIAMTTSVLKMSELQKSSSMPRNESSPPVRISSSEVISSKEIIDK